MDSSLQDTFDRLLSKILHVHSTLLMSAVDHNSYSISSWDVRADFVKYCTMCKELLTSFSGTTENNLTKQAMPVSFLDGDAKDKT